MSQSTIAQQVSLPLPRFHFGNALEAAIHAASIDNHNQREQLNQEQRIDRAQIEADDAAENEARWRAWVRQNPEATAPDKPGEFDRYYTPKGGVR